jgi:hypothetical protein
MAKIMPKRYPAGKCRGLPPSKTSRRSDPVETKVAIPDVDTVMMPHHLDRSNCCAICQACST